MTLKCESLGQSLASSVAFFERTTLYLKTRNRLVKA